MPGKRAKCVAQWSFRHSPHFYIKEIWKNGVGRFLCIVASEEQAYDLAHELGNLIGRERIGLFLERDFVFMKENSTRWKYSDCAP